MSVNSIGSSSNVAQLAQQIAAAIDTNGDGQVTTGEFATFLQGLLQTTSGIQGSSAQGQGEGGAAPQSVDPSLPSSLIAPTNWTGNPSPNGTTFAGFSQLNHTDLSVADLVGGGQEKYLAYDYLLSNHVAADSSWAPAAADALNKLQGTNAFHATDGETLAYGNEFIHTAPNGWGLPRGTYDPNASSEFFWGVTTDDV